MAAIFCSCRPLGTLSFRERRRQIGKRLCLKFSHANEKAEPGYYSVRLDDDGILAELTPLPSVGLHRYTFPKSQLNLVTLDLKWRDKLLDSDFKVVLDNPNAEHPKRAGLKGIVVRPRGQRTRLYYFVARIFRGRSNGQFELQTANAGEDVVNKKIVLGFESSGDHEEQALLKVAISYCLHRRCPQESCSRAAALGFRKVRADAKAAWNKELGKIEVSGGTR